jgi:hypothetical protein
VIKSWRIRWTGHVENMGEIRSAYKILVRKPEGKRSFGSPRHRCEGNIKMDLREIGCEGMDWIHLAQHRNQCRLLQTWYCTFGFHKKQGIS